MEGREKCAMKGKREEAKEELGTGRQGKQEGSDRGRVLPTGGSKPDPGATKAKPIPFPTSLPPSLLAAFLTSFCRFNVLSFFLVFHSSEPQGRVDNPPPLRNYDKV